MDPTYCFPTLNELVNFLEQFLTEMPGRLPAVYKTSAGEFAIKTRDLMLAGKKIDLKLSQWKAVEKPFSHQSKEISRLDILSCIRLKPWSSARDFSVELLILLKGSRADFERTRDYLFKIEHGAEPPFKIQAALVSFIESGDAQASQDYSYLLRLSGLHAYAPLERWLEDKEKFDVYYPYNVLPDPGLRHSRLYLQWGYEISALKIRIFDDAFFADRVNSDDELILLDEGGRTRNLVPDFQPLFYFHNVEIANPGGRVRGSQVSLETKELFDVKLQLRPQINPLPGLEYSETKLLERIDILRIQLERLRLKDATAFSPHIYVYEDGGSGMRSFQDFILRLPVKYLNQYLYTRMELDFDGRKTTFHFVVAKQDVSIDGRKPFNADYEFYKWNQEFIAGYNIYLPVKQGEKLVLFPPIFPETESDEYRCITTLMGEYATMYEKGSRDCLLLWPADENIFQVHLPLTTGSVDLGRASAAINTNFVIQKSGPLRSAPELLEYTIKEAFDKELPKFLETSGAIRQEIENAWQHEQEKIRALFIEVKNILRQAERASAQAEQIRCIYQNINDIRDGNLNEWYAFVEKVLNAHRTISENVDSEQEKMISLTESLQIEIQRTERVLTEEVTALVDDLRKQLPDNKSQKSLLLLSQQIETLLAEIQAQADI